MVNLSDFCCGICGNLSIYKGLIFPKKFLPTFLPSFWGETGGKFGGTAFWN